MKTTVKNFEIELGDNLLIVRKNGETIRATEVNPNEAVQKFNELVARIRNAK